MSPLLHLLISFYYHLPSSLLLTPLLIQTKIHLYSHFHFINHHYSPLLDLVLSLLPLLPLQLWVLLQSLYLHLHYLENFLLSFLLTNPHFLLLHSFSFCHLVLENHLDLVQIQLFHSHCFPSLSFLCFQYFDLLFSLRHLNHLFILQTFWVLPHLNYFTNQPLLIVILLYFLVLLNSRLHQHFVSLLRLVLHYL